MPATPTRNTSKEGTQDFKRKISKRGLKLDSTAHGIIESLSEYRLRRRKGTDIKGADSSTNISNRRVDSSSRDIRNIRGAKSRDAGILLHLSMLTGTQYTESHMYTQTQKCRET